MSQQFSHQNLQELVCKLGRTIETIRQWENKEIESIKVTLDEHHAKLTLAFPEKSAFLVSRTSSMIEFEFKLSADGEGIQLYDKMAVFDTLNEDAISESNFLKTYRLEPGGTLSIFTRQEIAGDIAEILEMDKVRFLSVVQNHPDIEARAHEVHGALPAHNL